LAGGKAKGKTKAGMSADEIFGKVERNESGYPLIVCAVVSGTIGP
jgi:hypothetical protein